MSNIFDAVPAQQEQGSKTIERPRLVFRSVVQPSFIERQSSAHSGLVEPSLPSVPSYQQSEWLSRASMKHAPPLLKGICNYLKSTGMGNQPTSCHRFILVGAPGTGKTTMARAVAWYLGRPVEFVSASSLLGQYRNETAVNIRTCLSKSFNQSVPGVLVIDELHKLFERHADGKTDHAENAATFWLMLDEFEKRAPHILVIGTANSVSSLPPELKSRFCGKIISMNLPTKTQQIQAFKDIASHDQTILLDAAIDDAYISAMLDRVYKSSLRDVQLLLDTAKMFTYVSGQSSGQAVCVLTRHDFDRAAAQLLAENTALKPDFFERFGPKAKQVALILSIAVNCGVLSQMVFCGMKVVAKYPNMI
jgi:hypothetical protein